MGIADDGHGDADSLAEIGSMPPLPQPRMHPTARSPVSVLSNDRDSATRRFTPPVSHANPVSVNEKEADDDEEPSPAPTPHAHPLRGWIPKPEEINWPAFGTTNGAGTALVEHLRRSPTMRRRDVDIKRLDPTFLNRERIAAFADREGLRITIDQSIGDPIEPFSTRLLEQRIHQVENDEQVELRPLQTEERQLAATEASEWRQFGYDGLADDDNGRSIKMDPDTALERARARKVKKQVDPKWLQMHIDMSLRPAGPLERPDELAFYDSAYTVTMDELVKEGVLFDDQDRKNAFSVVLKDWDDLAMDHRGTTGVCGSCFDAWAFQY